ncbi:BTAD domain-containing putative transcriptional regulator [Amaricoccus sp.]|uniref:BTAD domain-containing putative transcriptional regulator n=1 Tax=Amaricoccus sp. TaxID=1872485 RepID=UPI002BCD09FA|nr:BTAD domain-containing putative transcriptional regulator [Amaricoccus sp.]HMR60120.1 BTAD domain-containing putative transcriptional regulator [Amaricoccus sp.]
MLAYLAVPPGGRHGREALAALFWPDRQSEQARGSLRAALSDIRRALGKDALEADRDTVALRPDALVSDYARLRAAARQPTDAGLPNDLYPGPFLNGVESGGDALEDWLRDRRAECTALAIVALERAADHLAAAGHHAQALALMRRCLGLEPLREASHRAIMRLLAASGERALALAQFRACRELLRHELDTEPAPETVALADDIALDDSSSLAVLRATGSAAFDPPLPPPGSAAVPRPIDEAPLRPAIAVLPFVNLSGDAEQGYLADGITEDIITDLAGIDGLSVAAHTSSGMYRGGVIEPDRIAEELGVSHVLEGSLRMAGPAVRIPARLADARSMRQIWAERYDRNLEGIFELQSEIAAAIVQALRLNLDPGAATIQAARGTRDVEAYREYLRSRALLREMTRRSIELARDGFARAIALDPDYAAAHAGRADSISQLAYHHDAADWDQAIEESETALRLQPGLAEGLCARGTALGHCGRLDEALADFATAVRLNPQLYEAQYHYGLTYLLAGRLEEAAPHLRRAFEISDKELQAGMMLICCLLALDRRQECNAVCRHVIAVCRRRISLNTYDERAAYVMGMALNGLGETERARRWAQVAAAFEPEDPRATYNIACLFALLGEAEPAIRHLARTLALGVSDKKREWIRIYDPDLAVLHGDARFEALFASES